MDQQNLPPEVLSLYQLVENANLPISVKERVGRMLARVSRMTSSGSYSKEFESIEQYISWITRFPWGKYKQQNLDLDNAREELNRYHYGLQHVKDTIIEYLAVMKLNQDAAERNQSATDSSVLRGSSANAPVLCFVGIQGVGKTSIAKSIARSLNRDFVRIALGAMANVSQIRGVARTEKGAEPGQIVKGIANSGSMNPVILLDEIDKTSSQSGLRADLMAALLEILDPEQNSTFTDQYLDVPIDLSQVIFITTANNLGGISAALLDRLEVIRFGSYSDDEKVQIAKDYMLPKVRAATGLSEEQLDFDDDVWELVVRPLGFDAGVRQLERTLTILARKVALLIVEGKVESVKISSENFRQFIPEDIGVYS